jgi:16S rRNA (cytosine967-C5)-methyltransferase
LVDAEHGHGMFLALSERDRALVRAILRTALRFRGTISHLLRARLEKDLPPNAAALKHLLHVAAAQILFLDVPAHAAVDLAVAQAKADPRAARFAAFVNGVLRALVRARDAEPGPTLATGGDAPDWFADRLRRAYGAKAEAILAAHRVEAPTDFTVKADAGVWAERLGAALLPTGSLRLPRLPAAVPELSGFAEGEWWVQDAAAALPARLLGDIAGKRVADLCAAPGGKTAQLALAGARVTALDLSRSRLKRLRGNLARLGLDAETVEADVLEWRPEIPFDAVLLDAPCSSTGTVRRHPDIPWTKTPADIEALAGLQRRLLERAVGFVRPGGRIVFSNCSLDPLEGEDLLADFLRSTPGVCLDPVAAGEVPGIAPFVRPDGTLRTTPADLDLGDPAMSGLDGFFAARFVRVS